MRVFLLCLLLAAEAVAQKKEISFQQVAGGTFAGFSEDEKAEKIWEATAKFMRPTAEAGVWDMEAIKVQSLRGGKPWAVFTSPNGTMTPARRAAQGNGPVQSSSPAFKLTGKGWSWRSTSKGDSFAILADVVAERPRAETAGGGAQPEPAGGGEPGAGEHVGGQHAHGLGVACVVGGEFPELWHERSAF